jgi:hypothetical protein|nr:MAG TPA: hypothetical protein [Caudoviricetes sp.]
MKNSNEIEDINVVVNNLLVQNSLSMAKQEALASLLFDLVSENFPEKAQSVYTNYVDRFESATEEMLNHIDKLLLPDSDPAFLIRQKMSMKMNFLEMKNSPLYSPLSQTDD